MKLVRTTIDMHRQLRRRFAPGQTIGPAWTILVSATLLEACKIAGIDAEEIIMRLHRHGGPPQLHRGAVFSALLKSMPGCSYIRFEAGILRVRCDGGIPYNEEGATPKLMLPAVSVPETVRVVAAGRRLSDIVDTSNLPALNRLNPAIRRLTSKGAARALGGPRLEMSLDVEWHTMTLMPERYATSSGLVHADTSELPSIPKV